MIVKLSNFTVFTDEKLKNMKSITLSFFCLNIPEEVIGEKMFYLFYTVLNSSSITWDCLQIVLKKR